MTLSPLSLSLWLQVIIQLAQIFYINTQASMKDTRPSTHTQRRRRMTQSLVRDDKSDFTRTQHLWSCPHNTLFLEKQKNMWTHAWKTGSADTHAHFCFFAGVMIGAESILTDSSPTLHLLSRLKVIVRRTRTHNSGLCHAASDSLTETRWNMNNMKLCVIHKQNNGKS